MEPAPGNPDDAASLRAWAKGLYPLEAATELLIRTGFAEPHEPWVRAGDQPGALWVDFAAIPHLIGERSGGEQRLLRFAASLGNPDTPICLEDTFAGLDRVWVALILAAVAHAAGTHEGSGITRDEANPGTMRITRLTSLYPWPPLPDK